MLNYPERIIYLNDSNIKVSYPDDISAEATVKKLMKEKDENQIKV